MKFNLEQFRWSYDSPSVGSGNLFWGPRDVVNGQEYLYAILNLLQNSVSISGVSQNWIDVYRNLSTSMQTGNYSRFINESGQLQDIAYQNILTQKWVSELCGGRLGGRLQPSGDNFFYAYISPTNGIYEESYSYGYVNGIGTWKPIPSGQVLEYTINTSTSGVVQKLDGSILQTVYPVKSAARGNLSWDYHFASGLSFRIEDSAYPSLTNGSTSQVPVSMKIKGVRKTKQLARCDCNFGFDETNHISCRKCFGLGYVGNTAADYEYIQFPNSGIIVDYNSGDKYFSGGSGINAFFGNTLGSLYLEASNSGSVKLDSFGSYCTVTKERDPLDLKSIRWVYDTLQTTWSGFKPGITNMSFADATFTSGSPFLDVVKFNYDYDAYNPSGSWPVDNIGFTPLSKKHFEPIANAFQRCYLSFFSTDNKCVVVDVAAAMKSSGNPTPEWSYSILESGTHRMAKGYPLNPYIDVDHNYPSSRFTPGRLLYVEPSGVYYTPSGTLVVPSGDYSNIISIVASYGPTYSGSEPQKYFRNTPAMTDEVVLKTDGKVYKALMNDWTPSGVMAFSSNSGFLHLPSCSILGKAIGVKQDKICILNDSWANLRTASSGSILYEISCSGISDLVVPISNLDATNISNLYATEDVWIGSFSGALYPLELKLGPVFWIGSTANAQATCISSGNAYIGSNRTDSKNDVVFFNPELSVDTFGDTQCLSLNGGAFSSPYKDDGTFDAKTFSKIGNLSINTSNGDLWCLTTGGLVKIHFNTKSVEKFKWQKPSVDEILSHRADPYLDYYNNPVYDQVAANIFYYNSNVHLCVTYITAYDTKFYRLEIENGTVRATEISNPVSASVTARRITDSPAFNGYLISDYPYGGGTRWIVNTALSSILYDSPEVSSAAIFFGHPGIRGSTHRQRGPMWNSVNDGGDVIQLSKAITVNKSSRKINTVHTPKFLMSFAENHSANLPFFGHTYSYATDKHFISRTIPDNHIVGKSLTRTGRDILSIKPISSVSLKSTIGGGSISSNSGSGSFVVQEYYIDPYAIDTYAELGSNDKEPSVRGIKHQLYGQFSALGSTYCLDESFKPLVYSKAISNPSYGDPYNLILNQASGLISRGFAATITGSLPSGSSNRNEFFEIDSVLSVKGSGYFNWNPTIWHKYTPENNTLYTASGLFFGLSTFLYQDHSFDRKTITTSVSGYNGGYATLYDGSTSGVTRSIDFANCISVSTADGSPWPAPQKVYYDTEGNNATHDILRSVQKYNDRYYFDGRFSTSGVHIPNFMGFDQFYLWGSTQPSGNILQAYNPWNGIPVSGLTYVIPESGVIKAFSCDGGLFASPLVYNTICDGHRSPTKLFTENALGAVVSTRDRSFARYNYLKASGTFEHWRISGDHYKAIDYHYREPSGSIFSRLIHYLDNSVPSGYEFALNQPTIIASGSSYLSYYDGTYPMMYPAGNDRHYGLAKTYSSFYYSPSGNFPATSGLYEASRYFMMEYNQTTDSINKIQLGDYIHDKVWCSGILTESLITDPTTSGAAPTSYTYNNFISLPGGSHDNQWTYYNFGTSGWMYTAPVSGQVAQVISDRNEFGQPIDYSFYFYDGVSWVYNQHNTVGERYFGRDYNNHGVSPNTASKNLRTNDGMIVEKFKNFVSTIYGSGYPNPGGQWTVYPTKTDSGYHWVDSNLSTAGTRASGLVYYHQDYDDLVHFMPNVISSDVNVMNFRFMRSSGVTLDGGVGTTNGYTTEYITANNAVVYTAKNIDIPVSGYATTSIIYNNYFNQYKGHYNVLASGGQFVYHFGARHNNEYFFLTGSDRFTTTYSTQFASGSYPYIDTCSNHPHSWKNIPGVH